MALTVTSEVPYVSVGSDELAEGRPSYGYDVPSQQDFDILSMRINDLQFGSDRYPLWRSVIGRLLPEPSSDRYRFQLDGLMSIAGEGETPREAIDAFREKF